MMARVAAGREVFLLWDWQSINILLRHLDIIWEFVVSCV
jgi:hypothetical protein